MAHAEMNYINFFKSKVVATFGLAINVYLCTPFPVRIDNVSPLPLTMQHLLLFHPLLKMPWCQLLSRLTLEELLLRTAVQEFTPFQDPRL